VGGAVSRSRPNTQGAIAQAVTQKLYMLSVKLPCYYLVHRSTIVGRHSICGWVHPGGRCGESILGATSGGGWWDVRVEEIRGSLWGTIPWLSHEG
jgi:hypothetical protein